MRHFARTFLGRLALVLAVALTVPTVHAQTSSLRETSDFAEIAAHVEGLAAKYGPGCVLVASDLDNTLLAMDQDLGSDQWFVWQEYLLAAEPQSPQLVAPDFDGLLKVQGVLFSALPMHPPQPDLPSLIKRIQDRGVRTIVLTARGDDFRRDAEQELAAAGFDFCRTPLEVTGMPPESATATGATYAPYTPATRGGCGVTAEEFQRWRLPDEPKGVSYKNGLCMVSGQHKGAMLAMLLAKATKPPKAVVFIDQEKQVRRVADAMLSRGYDFTGFDYQREDMKVKRFAYGDKTAVVRQWEGMKAALEKPAAPVEPQSPRQPAKAASNVVPAR